MVACVGEGGGQLSGAATGVEKATLCGVRDDPGKSFEDVVGFQGVLLGVLVVGEFDTADGAEAADEVLVPGFPVLVGVETGGAAGEAVEDFGDGFHGRSVA